MTRLRRLTRRSRPVTVLEGPAKSQREQARALEGPLSPKRPRLDSALSLEGPKVRAALARDWRLENVSPDQIFAERVRPAFVQPRKRK